MSKRVRADEPDPRHLSHREWEAQRRRRAHSPEREADAPAPAASSAAGPPAAAAPPALVMGWDSVGTSRVGGVAVPHGLTFVDVVGGHTRKTTSAPRVHIADDAHSYYPVAVMRGGALLTLRCETTGRDPRVLLLDPNNGAVVAECQNMDRDPSLLITPDRGGIAISSQYLVYATHGNAMPREFHGEVVLNVVSLDALTATPRRVSLVNCSYDGKSANSGTLAIQGDRAFYAPNRTFVPLFYDVSLAVAAWPAGYSVPRRAESTAPIIDMYEGVALCFFSDEVLLRAYRAVRFSLGGLAERMTRGPMVHRILGPGEALRGVAMDESSWTYSKFGVRYHITMRKDGDVCYQDQQEVFRSGISAAPAVLCKATDDERIDAWRWCCMSLDGRMLVIQDRVSEGKRCSLYDIAAWPPQLVARNTSYDSWTNLVFTVGEIPARR